MSRVLAILALGALALLTLPARAQGLSDTTPPTLLGLNFAPRTVDVSTAAATVTGTMQVRDDLSGFSYGFAYFYSPSRGQNVFAYANLTAGSALDGTAQFTATIPRSAEAGVWVLTDLYLYDRAGNRQILQTTGLAQLGFPTTLTVVSSSQDTQPPQLLSFNLSPRSIDVSAGPQSIVVSIGVSDSQSAIPWPCTNVCYYPILLRSPSGIQIQQEAEWNFRQVSGTAQSGVWQVTVTLPRYAEAGVWRVDYLLVRDAIGNLRYLYTNELASLGHPTTIQVASTPSDTQPPQLTGLTLGSSFVDTSAGPRNMSVAATLVDNLSGLNMNFAQASPGLSRTAGYVYFVSPSGGQNFAMFLNEPRLSGTALNGTWGGSRFLPQYSEAGTWTLSQAYFSDAVGNMTSYTTAQLRALGFPITFQVILPSLVSDGTLPAGGGTVLDNVFGARASVTVPPGLLTQPTTVSIDVLSPDLRLPVPAGFSTNATNFVTVKLTPALTPPFPAPGLTITLPLLSQMAPGTTLTLYKVDPLSGNLVPEPSVSGGPAVGTVNADGLSATFTGVASLSTLVGLIRNAGVVGDLDGDGLVNCTDVAIVRTAFGKRSGQAGYDSRADTNRDGVINVRDLAFVSRNLPSGLVCRITDDGAAPAPRIGNLVAPR